MAFNPSTITSVDPPEFEAGHVVLRWQSPDPVGTWYQVYLDGRLVWWGIETQATIPYPSGRVRIDIGVVANGEQETDFSGSIVTRSNCARLDWKGGAIQAPDLASFRIYGEHSPGAGIDYITPIDEITAFPGDVYLDGFGMGGFGEGSFGTSIVLFSWVSNPLAGGTWAFAVVPVDTAGNEGVPRLGTQHIVAPPGPPGLNAFGQRLTYTYSFATKQVTLSWLPSPG